MQEIRVLIDNRERNQQLLRTLESSGAKTSFMQLPVADYIISDRMCIERKTITDFENSIIDTRLFDQANRMGEAFTKPILIVEGRDSDSRLGRNVMYGAITSIYSDYNIQVIRTETPEESAYAIFKLAEREQGVKDRSPKVLGRKKAHNTHEWQIMLLSSVPGVGPKLSKQLLSEFKSVRGVFSASVEELMVVDKIGKKKAEKIYTVVNSVIDQLDNGDQDENIG